LPADWENRFISDINRVARKWVRDIKSLSHKKDEASVYRELVTLLIGVDDLYKKVKIAKKWKRDLDKLEEKWEFEDLFWEVDSEVKRLLKIG